MKTFVLCLFACACLTACGDEPKAVIVLVDGIPADVIESTSTPNLDAIAGSEGYTRAYVGGEVGTPSESPTVSAVGYASLMTGTWSYKNGVWDNAIDDPDYSYWDIFRIAKEHDRKLHTAIFSTWTDNRTKLLGDGIDAAGGHKIDYHADGYELDTERFPHDAAAEYIRSIDALVTKEAADYIESRGPDLSWVYLQYTDDVGHEYGDSPEMEAAVQLMDTLVGKIWEAVQQRQKTSGEDWMVVVTTDHGRDSVSGREHGGQTPRERSTWFVTNSERLNARFTDNPAIVDVLPSVAKHLELDMPAEVQSRLDGESFID